MAGRPPTPTCFVANHAGTRRDFILADAHLMTMPLGFEVAEEDTFPVHKPVRMDIGHQQQPCFVYRGIVPKDPMRCMQQGLDSDEGVGTFQRALGTAFQDAEDSLTRAALGKDTTALHRTWTRALEKAYVECLAPEHKEGHGLRRFRGRGDLLVRRVRLEPPQARSLDADHVAKVF